MTTPENKNSAAFGASELSALLCDARWSESSICDGDDTLYTTHLTDGGRITVLDRMTGYSGGIRDIESGYKDHEGNFWLASGMCDVRWHPDLTMAQAVEWIKARANTCVGA